MPGQKKDTLQLSGTSTRKKEYSTPPKEEDFESLACSNPWRLSGGLARV